MINSFLDYYYAALRVPRYQATNIGSRLEYGAEIRAFPCAKVVIIVGIAKSSSKFLFLHNKRYDESI